MKNVFLKWLFMFTVATSVWAFVVPAKKIKVWMIGDSTMCDYPGSRSPLTGWGMPFKDFFDTTVTIKNMARGGRSTRTFISEGRWKNVYDSLEAADYVLIQFGHNDEAKEPQYAARYTPVPDYKNNLIKFITEARSKKAKPVLITPVTRMQFDANGNIKETHKEYSAAVWEIGKEYEVPVIDLDAKSRQLLQNFGPDKAKLLFMHLDSLENPHYPKGNKDNTHFNEFGARKMAQLVVKEIQTLKLDLAARMN